MDTSELRDLRQRFIFQGGSEFACGLADELDRLRAENEALRRKLGERLPCGCFPGEPHKVSCGT